MVPSSQSRPRFPGRRQWSGAVLAAAGAVLLFLGWYGVSGQVTIGEQMPYVVSGSIPGAALVVAAAVVLAGESSQRAAERTHELMAELHALLVEEVPIATLTSSANSAADGCDFVALLTGEHYHRPACVLVAGKVGVQTVDAAAIAARHLVACPVCDPVSDPDQLAG